MEDTKNATKVEEIEQLRLQVINLRIEALEKERAAMVKVLLEKYGPFEAIVAGVIHRAPEAPTPLIAVPEGA